MTDDIKNQAVRLGDLLAASDEMLALKSAEEAGQRDAALTAAVARFMETRARLEDETRRDDKDFAAIGALTRELDELSESMHALPAYVRIQTAREALNGVLKSVNAIINARVFPGEAACGGDCGACQGCGGQG